MIPKNCNFCGLCCTLAVKVTDEEVRRIEKLGHRDFTEKDPDGNTLLKRHNGLCHFFGKKGNIGYCKIYNARPKPCDDFPGEICELRDNVFFNDLSNKPDEVKKLWKNAPKKDDIPEKKPEFPL